MRRVNKVMRKSVDYSGLMYWQFLINALDAEKLREKDQAEKEKK